MYVRKTLDNTSNKVSLRRASRDHGSSQINPKTGLCIRVFDVFEIGDGVVHACMDGSCIFPVKFRLIVFKPFTGEILTGKIVNAIPEDLRGAPTRRVLSLGAMGSWARPLTPAETSHPHGTVSIECFDDILIADELLKPDTTYNKDQSQWVWQYQDEESSEVQEMDLEHGKLIRFRVEVEHFNEVRPQTPLPGTNAMTPKMPSGTGKELRSSAYWIECSIIDDDWDC